MSRGLGSEDVRQAADESPRSSESEVVADYLADKMLRSAVERRLKIIGEALNRLARTAPELAAPIPELRRAVAMRNALIHGYQNIDNETVWRTARDSLPLLRAQVAILLPELGETP